MLEVFIGSGLGGVLRYLFSLISKKFFLSSWPATLIVNVIGAILLVFLLKKSLVSDLRYSRLIISGFLGGFTTFSTFSYEVYENINQGNYLVGAVIFLLNIVLGVAMGILIFR